MNLDVTISSDRVGYVSIAILQTGIQHTREVKRIYGSPGDGGLTQGFFSFLCDDIDNNMIILSPSKLSWHNVWLSSVRYKINQS